MEMNQEGIVVDGVVGVGKTTLMELLKEEGYRPFPEPVVDNPLLDKFYHDRKRYSFPLQIFFLNKRFEHIKQAKKAGKKVVMDRSIYGDIIFAKMLKDSGDMTVEEYNIYEELLQNMLEHCQPPKLMVYLRVSTDEAMRRIQKRGRDFELNVERSYWETLNREYEQFFNSYNHSKMITIDVNDLDFEHNEKDRKYVMDRVKQALGLATILSS